MLSLISMPILVVLKPEVIFTLLSQIEISFFENWPSYHTFCLLSKNFEHFLKLSFLLVNKQQKTKKNPSTGSMSKMADKMALTPL